MNASFLLLNFRLWAQFKDWSSIHLLEHWELLRCHLTGRCTYVFDLNILFSGLLFFFRLNSDGQTRVLSLILWNLDHNFMRLLNLWNIDRNFSSLLILDNLVHNFRNLLNLRRRHSVYLHFLCLSHLHIFTACLWFCYSILARLTFSHLCVRLLSFSLTDSSWNRNFTHLDRLGQISHFKHEIVDISYGLRLGPQLIKHDLQREQCWSCNWNFGLDHRECNLLNNKASLLRVLLFNHNSKVRPEVTFGHLNNVPNADVILTDWLVIHAEDSVGHLNIFIWKLGKGLLSIHW